MLRRARSVNGSHMDIRSMPPSARDPARACAPRVPSGPYYIRKYSTLAFESAAPGTAMRKERTARPSRDLNDGENGLKRVPVLAAPVPDENGGIASAFGRLGIIPNRYARVTQLGCGQLCARSPIGACRAAPA